MKFKERKGKHHTNPSSLVARTADVMILRGGEHSSVVGGGTPLVGCTIAERTAKTPDDAAKIRDNERKQIEASYDATKHQTTPGKFWKSLRSKKNVGSPAVKEAVDSAFTRTAQNDGITHTPSPQVTRASGREGTPQSPLGQQRFRGSNGRRSDHHASPFARSTQKQPEIPTDSDYSPSPQRPTGMSR